MQIPPRRFGFGGLPLLEVATVREALALIAANAGDLAPRALLVREHYTWPQRFRLDAAIVDNGLKWLLIDVRGYVRGACDRAA